ncbi:hypothetical protein O9929_16840 [Vibrio lentus]|nr:hypothetical protein [Vibrio lentus]
MTLQDHRVVDVDDNIAKIALATPALEKNCSTISTLSTLWYLTDTKALQEEIS